MDKASESLAGAAAAAADDGPVSRIDWRTGQSMIQHDDAFWLEHERRRLEQGVSIPAYCAANGLALSTFRHRVRGKKRTVARRAAPSTSPVPGPAKSPAFLAVTAPLPEASAPATVEVSLQGMTMRLHGPAAERVLGCLLSRLA